MRTILALLLMCSVAAAEEPKKEQNARSSSLIDLQWATQWVKLSTLNIPMQCVESLTIKNNNLVVMLHPEC